MTSNTFTVITTTEAARIGDVVVATNHNDTAAVERGRLVDVRIDELILEKGNGYRVALPIKDWSFTAAPPAPAAFEAVEVACTACASKPEGGTTAPSVEEIARVIAAHPHAVPNAKVLAEEIRALYAGHALDSLLDARRKRIAVLEAEVARLSALAANKQTVIDEDRADAKRNRELYRSEIADLKHDVALALNGNHDANQRAAELAARIQELEVEAARLEHALEKADALIQALRHRYGTHVALGGAKEDDDRAARIIRDADEQNSAARQVLAEAAAAKAHADAEAELRDAPAEEKACSCGAPSAFSLTPGERFVHRADGPCFIEQVHDPKFGKLEAADLGPYTEVLKQAGVVAAAKAQLRWIRSQERDAGRSTASTVPGEGEAAPR